MSNLQSFLKSESGAVTVDWVVLTAAVASLGLAVAVAIGKPTTTRASEIADGVNKMSLLQY